MIGEMFLLPSAITACVIFLLLAIRLFISSAHRGSIMPEPYLGMDDLKEHARKLAAFPVIYRTGRRTPDTLRGLETRLKAAAKALKGESGIHRWLYDNQQILSALILNAKRVKRRHGLPAVITGPGRYVCRISLIAKEYAAHSRCMLDEERIIAFLRAWQEAGPLKTAETAELTNMLKAELLKTMVLLTEKAAEDEKKAAAGTRFTKKLSAGKKRGTRKLTDPVFLEAAIKAANENGSRETLDRIIKNMGIDAESAVNELHMRRAAMNELFLSAAEGLGRADSLDMRLIYEKTSAVYAAYMRDDSFLLSDRESRAAALRRTERLAKAMGIFETATAEKALSAADADESGRGIYHFLFGDGIKELVGKTPFFARKANKPLYFASVYAPALAAALMFCMRLPLRTALTAFLPAAVLLADITKKIVARIWESTHAAPFLPSLDLEKTVPDGARTAITVSALTAAPQDVNTLFRRLEAHYHSSGKGNLYYVLLADYKDSDTQSLPEDADIINTGNEAARKLNERFSPEEDIFFFCIRNRRYCGTEGRFTAPERKRGALSDLAAALTGHKGDIISSSPLPDGIKYILALDADTVLPPGCARRLIGVKAHPMQEARMKDGKTVGGYGIIAPAAHTLEPYESTRFQKLFGGDTSADAYISGTGTYMRLFGRGNYSGKGIFDIRAFSAATDGKIPDESVLSHDLLEGEYCMTAEDGAAKIYDVCPKNPLSYLKREHRWIRGDWQLLPWLHGRRLDPLSKYKIAENLVRHLYPVFWLTLLFTAGAAGSRGIAALLFISLFYAPITRFFRVMFSKSDAVLSDTADSGEWLRAAYRFAIMPRLAHVSLDAVIRTCVRLKTRRHLLSWTTAAEAERTSAKGMTGYCAAEYMQFPFAAAALACAFLFNRAFIAAAVIWAAGPAISFILGKTFAHGTLPEDDRAFLHDAAKKTWKFFADTVCSRDNFLPPDNIVPESGKTARRTSPTNIGLYMVSALCAAKTGIITMREAEERIRDTLGTIEKAEKYRGHLYNWYDTATLEPLRPRYVSLVDSGNLAVCCITAAEMLRDGGADENLCKRLLSIYENTDFDFLYDGRRDLFRIGYDAERNAPSPAYYDLLISEARLTSIAALSRGIPARHWYALGRPKRKYHGTPMLLSWSGTMFEYLLPELFMNEHGLLRASCEAATALQAGYAGKQGMPWGISESGRARRDAGLSYQYKAFGIPFAAMSKEPYETVISPYSSAMALCTYPRMAVKNLRLLKTLGMLTDAGYYEALDYSGGKAETVKSHMAHHQGMIMLALCSALCGGYVQKAFSSSPYISNSLPLLQESLPYGGFEPVESGFTGGFYRAAYEKSIHTAKQTSLPDCLLLSNGRYSVFTTDLGAGSSCCCGTAVTRENAFTREDKGIFAYIRDVDSGTVFSPTGYPARADGQNVKIRFSQDRAVWETEAGGLSVNLSLCVDPEHDAEIRLFEIRNRTMKPRRIELTVSAEPSFAPTGHDTHPAFTKLFITAEKADYISGCVFAKNPRGNEDAMYEAFTLSGAGIYYGAETDRLEFLSSFESGAPRPGRFVGEGTSLDPIAAAKRRIVIEPGRTERVYCCISFSGDREQAVRTARLLSDWQAVQRCFSLAASYARANTEYHSLTAGEANAACGIMSAALFPSEPGRTYDRHLLYPLGISGERPVITVKVRGIADCAGAEKIVSAMRYLNARGFSADTVLLNMHGNDYRQPVADRLQAAISGTAGMHYLCMSDENKDIADNLLRASVLVLEGGNGLAIKRPKAQPYRHKAAHTLSPAMPGANGGHLRFFSGYGGFSESGYDITAAGRTPLPWSQVLANKTFGAIITENGAGYIWYKNAQTGRITPWLCDPAEPRTFDVIIGSGNETKSVFTPEGNRTVHYEPGMAVWHGGTNGAKYRAELFIHPDINALFINISIKNTGSVPALFRAAPLFMLDGARAEIEKDSGVITAVCGKMRVYLAAGKDAVFFSDASEIFGRGGYSPSYGSGGFCGAGPSHPALAAYTETEIQPGEEKSMLFAIGADDRGGGRPAFIDDAILQGAEQLPDETTSFWDKKLKTIKICTGEGERDAMLNGPLLYQVYAARLWGRSGYYQSGGAYGFRDQLQDVLALLYTDKGEAQEHILRAAEHQYAEGDVQHWWHEPRSGVRTRISDDMLFLPYVLYEYISFTGDRTILFEKTAYLTSPPLNEDEADRYEQPAVSGYRGTLFEHCEKAMERAMVFGEHGLPLMGGGDWNDAMNRIGIKGRGESVWLGWFMAETMRRFAEMCRITGQEAKASLYRNSRALLIKNIEDSAWAGDRYLRAFDDEGRPVGGAGADSCEIDLISQAWAVIAGGNRERGRTAMETAFRLLYDGENGIIKLLTPPFKKDGRDIGYIQGYLPGVRENGGQYTHAAIWAMAAYALLGDAEKANACWRAACPIYHSGSAAAAEKYMTEPYAMAADIYGTGKSVGRGGWTWYTGSAAWAYYAMLKYCLGIELRDGRPQLCGSAVIDDYSVRMLCGGIRYDIDSKNGGRNITAQP